MNEQITKPPSNPPHSDSETQKKSKGLWRVVACFVLYLLCSGPSLFYGYLGLVKECTDNFEGGCGYGQAWAAIISFVLAIFLSAPSGALFAITAWENKTLPPLAKYIAMLMIAPPFIFLATGLYQLIRIAVD